MANKERRRNKKVVREAKNDPAFYNDQIGENQESIKEIMDERKGRR